MPKYKYSTKMKADDLPKLYVWQFERMGYFTGEGLSVDIRWEDQIIAYLYFSITNKYMEITYPDSRISQNVELIKTKCYFGKYRYWFACPHCSRKVGTLYMSEEGFFSCLICLDLTYKSKNKNYRSKDYDLLKRCDNFIKANELIDQIKRYSYASRPTKKLEKIERLYSNSILI